MTESGSPRALDECGVVEVSVSVARDELADLVSRASYQGQVTYLTRRGRRVAALVPVQVAERAEQEADIAPASPLQLDADNLPGTAIALPNEPNAGPV